jgi:hypothetical protein
MCDCILLTVLPVRSKWYHVAWLHVSEVDDAMRLEVVKHGSERRLNA